jgi:hypothetical protein
VHFKLIIAGDNVGYAFDLNEGAQDNLHASEYFHQYHGMSNCIKIYVLTIRTHDQIFLLGDDDIHLPDEQDAMEFVVYTDGFEVTFEEEELSDSDDEQDQETQQECCVHKSMF